MDVLIVIALLLVIGAPAAIAAAYAVARGPNVIATIFGFDRGPAWPRGVQEDDPPPRWRINGPGH
jgi:hypothetical protein